MLYSYNTRSNESPIPHHCPGYVPIDMVSIIPYITISLCLYYVVLYYKICYDVLSYIVLYYIIYFYVILYYAFFILCYIILCYFLLYYIYYSINNYISLRFGNPRHTQTKITWISCWLKIFLGISVKNCIVRMLVICPLTPYSFTYVWCNLWYCVQKSHDHSHYN